MMSTYSSGGNNKKNHYLYVDDLLGILVDLGIIKGADYWNWWDEILMYDELNYPKVYRSRWDT